jgi:hypothetical protein
MVVAILVIALALAFAVLIWGRAIDGESFDRLDHGRRRFGPVA